MVDEERGRAGTIHYRGEVTLEDNQKSLGGSLGIVK
jgi:hypothetical protein